VTAAPPIKKPLAKTDDKKKKKKGAKKNLGVAVPTALGLIPTDIAKINPSNSLGANNGAPAASPPPPPSSSNSPASFNIRPQLSLQDWEKTLLTQPDPTATQNFINQFKAGNVSSQTYYAIAKLMLTDTRPEMQLLGVEVAGAVHSYTAFNLLVGTLSTPSLAPQVAQAIQTQLGSYATISSLSVLETALRTPGSPTADIEAAGLITTLATQLAQSLHTQGVGGGNGGGSGQSYSAQFSPVAALLNSLIQTQGGNSMLVSKATQALQAISSLINA
jgi:hypothetical protein